MSVQLYVQYPNKGNTNPWILLDIKAEEEPIKLTLSVADITDPLKVASTYSRSFRIPHTETNGEFFKAVFDVNGTTYNPSVLAPSYINDNGETLVTGNIRLTGIYREDQSYGIWYEVLFMGETSDFSSNINGFYMSDIDMSKYNHALSYANITNSWQGGLFNGGIRYPLIEWGYSYVESGGAFNPEQVTIAMSGTPGINHQFTEAGYGLSKTQMKPAIQLKALWDAIIAPKVDQTGYATVSGSFVTIPVFPSPVPTGYYQNVTLTVATGLSYSSTGTQQVLCQFSDTIYMRGNVSNYNAATGAMTISVLEVSGSGTFNNWSVALVQPVGLSGYTYSSFPPNPSTGVLDPRDSFMNSDLFKNLYILTDSVARPEFVSDQQFVATTTQANSLQYFSTGSVTKVDVNQEIIDKSNAYNPTTSTYTTPSGGAYTFKITMEAYVDESCDVFPSPQCQKCRFNYLLRNVNNPSQTWQLNPFNIELNNLVGTGTYTLTSQSTYLPPNTPLELVIQVNNLTTGGSGASGFGFNVMSLRWETIVTPLLVNINSLFSNQIKVTDFIKGVIDKFKMVFIPSKERTREFQILPWINWVQSGASKDWTAKLDESIEYKVSPLFNGQSRNNVFKDNEDSDYLNYNYQQANTKTYGQLNLDSGNLLLNGETVRTNIFARTPLGPIGIAAGAFPANVERAKKWLIPHLAKITSSASSSSPNPVNKVEPIQPKLRLVFWNGMQDNPAGSPPWNLKNDSVYGYTAQTQYPLVSDFQTWPYNPTTLDLRWSYAPPLYDATIQTITNPYAIGTVNAFNQYWKGWYDTVQDTYNRSIEVNLILNYADIKELLFNDYIFIKDAWYFVDSISDYIVGKTTSCKVKLYKVGNTLGVTLPNGADKLKQKTGCYHPTSVCGAVCCTNGILSSSIYFTTVTGAPTLFTTRLFTDPFGNVPAPTGKYSFGGFIWTVGNGGTVTGYVAAPICACGVTGGGGQQAKYVASTPETTGTLAGNVLCATPTVAPETVTVYGQQTDVAFEGNVRFFQDSALTIPVPDGIYYPVNDAVDQAWTVSESQVWQITDTGMCDCPSALYRQALAPGVTDCDACCFRSQAQDIWSDTEFVAAGTNLYFDQTGTTPVADGFWSDGGNVWETDASGLVIAEALCACGCTDVSSIVLNYTSVDAAGFDGYILLEKSFDLFNWFFVGVVNWDTLQPPNTTLSASFDVETNAWTRATAQNNTAAPGVMTVEYIIDAVTVQIEKVPTPYDKPVTVTSRDQARLGPVREFTATVYAY